MDADKLSAIEELLRENEIELTEGLSDDEIAAIERTYDFHFLPDLKALLQHMLPIGASFPDWRHESEESLRGRLEWPLDGICFDIEHDNFWDQRWGARPTLLTEAFEIARRQVEQAPRLIPVYSHRYLPAEPLLAGNPILSVYQTDMIYYGSNLWDYFCREFHLPKEAEPEPERFIRFWSDFVLYWGDFTSDSRDNLRASLENLE